MIIVAITGICSFAIPDFSLGFALRVFRFVYLILAYISGFLGIGLRNICTTDFIIKLKIFRSIILLTISTNRKQRHSKQILPKSNMEKEQKK
ncbi:MAG: spore germination protein [Clostridia bacterium]|nr:spore germination protein [Clostridia bacterium]